MESADIVLMRSDLMDGSNSLTVKQKHNSKYKAKFILGIYMLNVAGIPIAAGILYAFGGPKLNPHAAAAMSLSSVSVLTNALRLKGF